MNTISNISVNCKQYFLVFATVLLVLLTSCAVKGSIKNLAGIPTNTERGIPKSIHNFAAKTLEKCTQLNVESPQIVQKDFFNANNLLPAVILTATFLFLLGFRPLNKENEHPVYSSSSKIRSSIPIFLEYRKLIIHFAH